MNSRLYFRLLIPITALVVLLSLCGCPGLLSNQVQVGDKNAKVNIPIGWRHQIVDELVLRANASKVVFTKSSGNQSAQISVFIFKSSDAAQIIPSTDLSAKPEQKIVSTQRIVFKTAIDPSKLTLQSKGAGSGMLYYFTSPDPDSKMTNIYGIGDSGSCFVLISGSYPSLDEGDVGFLLSKVELN